MIIQTLSVAVPTVRCINNCKFCCAHMVEEPYKNQLDCNLPFYDLYEKEYLKRLMFARDNGCNTVMLTGNGEPQQNRKFLTTFGTYNNMLDKPFRWVEMQTTGVTIDAPYLRFLHNHVGVSTISISLSSLDDKTNAEICGMKIPVDLKGLCSEIKKYDFNLRMSINLTNEFEMYKEEQVGVLLNRCHEVFGADQVTFRVLYTSGNSTPQDEWIMTHRAANNTTEIINGYITTHGYKLEKLAYGAQKYSVNGMSVVIDNDCMAKNVYEFIEPKAFHEKATGLDNRILERRIADIYSLLYNSAVKDSEVYKYMILRPDCHLYSRWDDKASLIF